MKKSLVNLSVILIVILGLPFSAFTQTRVYPDLAVTITSTIPGTSVTSDYAVYFSYSSRGTVNCKWYTYHDLRIYMDGDADANIKYRDVAAGEYTTYSYILPIGPGANHRYGLRYREYSNKVYSCDEYSWSGFKKNDSGIWEPYAATSAERDYLWSVGRYSVTKQANTAPIKSPVNIKASDKAYFDKIDLTWTTGTNIPWASHSYRIYRGTTTNPAEATLVGNLPGLVNTWTDTTRVPNDVCYYWVTTYTDRFATVHESPRTTQNAVCGRTKTITVSASDGDYANSVRVDWDDLSSFFSNVKIERGIPNTTGKTQLAVLDKYGMVYNDNDVIPGYNYTYYVTPILSPRTWPTLSDAGFMKCNGKISGTVKSLQGSGVDHVKVCARPVTTIAPGAEPVPPQGYCTTTDMDGYYEIPGIYYYTQADFFVVPYKAGAYLIHDFTPDSLRRTLSQTSPTQSGVNFQDISVFTVGGKVVFPVSKTQKECGVPDVEILVNGQKIGKFTKPDGTWEYTIQQEGTYTFRPVFLHHRFENAQGQQESSILVNDNVPDINFTDMETDSIQVSVLSGCRTPIPHIAKVQITSPNVCYFDTLRTNANGLLTFKNLPARKYDIQVTALYPPENNIMNQIGNKPITVDLTVRDTAEVVTTRDEVSITPADTLQMPDGKIIITPADTVITTVSDTTREVVIPKAEFLYHSPLLISVDFEESGAEVVCDTFVLMEQHRKYKLFFNVFEQLGNCPVDEGKLLIYDQVSDREQTEVEVPVKNGKASYTIDAGKPQLAGERHKKYLMMIPQIGFLKSQPLTYWILVTGAVSQPSTFTTKSPSIPLFVLHDPPGDSSYCYISKGLTVTNFFKHEVLRGGEGGGYADLTFGGATEHFKAGGQVKFTITGGKDSITKNGWQTTISFEERFETPTTQDYAGHEGDVFLGASFNMEFALADELTFDRSACQPQLRTVPAANFTDFSTTFVYTEKHIKNTLIPSYRLLYDLTLAGREMQELSESEQKQAIEYALQMSNWDSILVENERNRGIRATPVKNISFSAGTLYAEDFTSDSALSHSCDYHILFNSEFAAGARIENDLGFWAQTAFGAIGKYRISDNTETGWDSLFHRKVGYIMTDRDAGDYFSVDVKKDRANGVPAFDLKTGATSCPWEPGSQKRDTASILIYPPEINNVPIGSAANFKAYLTNASQSRETRDYAVRVIPTTNPDGAVVKLAGTEINSFPVNFTLPYNQQSLIALTVEKGPYASRYEDIGIVMYPGCRLEGPTADTAWLTVDFQTECSNVSLYTPGDGWLVNQNSHNILYVAFTGYDLNDPKLQTITLQYKKEGGEWTDDIIIPMDSLKDVFYDYPFNVTALPDGVYSVRSKSYCGPDNAITWSAERTGTIDRTSIAPFGYPAPADGFLSPGEEISIAFDKDISCDLSSAYIKLLTNDSTEVPIIPQCYGNKIILMPQVDFFEGTEWKGVMLYATVNRVKDLSGNVQEYPVKWSFQPSITTGGNPFICPVPGIVCPENMTVASETGACGAQVFFPDVKPASDCGGPGITIEQTGGLFSGYFYPVGTTTNSYVLTNAEGKTATCSFTVTVVDNDPPLLSDLTADFDPFWPPNHKMIPVTVNYTTTDHCGTADCSIRVTSSEPGNSKGDGHTPVDIQVLDEHHILLKAERSGPGAGRTYTIFVTCTDVAGNITEKETSIFIPHDQSNQKKTILTDQVIPDKGNSSKKSAIISAGSGDEPFMAELWPNPTTNSFNIKVESASAENIVLYVSDILGRLIANHGITRAQTITFGEDLVPGVYFVTLRQGVYLKNIRVIKQ